MAHHLFNYTLIDTQTGTIINPANCVLVHDDRMEDLDDSASDSEINDFGIQYGHKLVDIVDDNKLC